MVKMFKCKGNLASFNSKSRTCNKAIAWILSNLEVRENVEHGIKAVDVEVVADGSVLYDVKLNGKSVGYFALRNFVNIIGLLSLPELIECVPENNGDLELFEYKVYTIPLFGEVENVA